MFPFFSPYHPYKIKRHPVCWPSDPLVPWPWGCCAQLCGLDTTHRCEERRQWVEGGAHPACVGGSYPRNEMPFCVSDRDTMRANRALVARNDPLTPIIIPPTTYPTLQILPIIWHSPPNTILFHFSVRLSPRFLDYPWSYSVSWSVSSSHCTSLVFTASELLAFKICRFHSTGGGGIDKHLGKKRVVVSWWLLTLVMRTGGLTILSTFVYVLNCP